MTESSDENVRLLIRCALQSFDDLPISCFSSWTVLQLKEKLAVDCPLKPDVKRQRLIYAGHCLHDEHTLKSVFELRPIDDGSVHVIHLVCPSKDFNTHVGAPLLRRRNTNRTQASLTFSENEAQARNLNVNGAFPLHSYSFWGNTTAQGGFTTSQSIPVTSSAHFQNAYQAYMISYSNYVYQMMSALENNFNGGQFPSQFLLNRQETVLQPPQQANQPEGAFAAGPNLAAAPAAGGIVHEAVAGDVNDQQRDFLDVIYKAIRMCFLIMLVYVYSSAERFFGVVLFILLVWFIQARRDRNNRERAARELFDAVDNVRQPQQVNVNEGDHGTEGSMNEGVTGIDEEEPREPTAWVVFWSTCYTFITSFFSSLIPDNPLPLNIN